MTPGLTKYRIAAALLLCAAWIWWSKAPAGSVSTGGIPAPQRGFQAPDFELIDADGVPRRLSDFRGQPVLLNFWASWCSPCKAEMPAMERIYQQYQTQGFVILAVNSTHQDNPANALGFASQLGLTFPILMDTNGDASRLYEVRALPSSFFIAENGRIEEVVIGGPMAEALLKIRVQQLLGEN